MWGLDCYSYAGSETDAIGGSGCTPNPIPWVDDQTLGEHLASWAAPRATAALMALRSHRLGSQSVSVGRVVAQHPGLVSLSTEIGGSRVVDMLPGDQLPRIC